MSKTTQEKRDDLRRRATIHAVLATRMGRQHTSTSVQPELLLGLLNDAERLARLEQQVRELADRLDEPEHDLLSGADLRALLNPPRPASS